MSSILFHSFEESVMTIDRNIGIFLIFHFLKLETIAEIGARITKYFNSTLFVWTIINYKQNSPISHLWTKQLKYCYHSIIPNSKPPSKSKQRTLPILFDSFESKLVTIIEQSINFNEYRYHSSDFNSEYQPPNLPIVFNSLEQSSLIIDKTPTTIFNEHHYHSSLAKLEATPKIGARSHRVFRVLHRFSTIRGHWTSNTMTTVQ